MRWVRREADGRQVLALAQAMDLHPVVARVLVARGLGTAAEAERFLSFRLTDLPDPFRMKGMERAVERIVRALDRGEKITVYGDYDVDGVTSTSLLVSFLRALGGEVDFYVPHRLAEGYGLNPRAVDTLAQRGTRLIVTVDCGVTAVDEVDRATRAGLDVVVVDHHKAPAELPRAVAMLNPHQPGCDFPSKELCAVGVVFHLAMALRRRLREAGFFERRPEPNLKNYLDLVALGTVADVVPLVNANRILVHHGLKEIATSRRAGIQALVRVAGLENGAITSGQVGFKLGPRINAAGRLDDAGTAVELMLTEDPDRAEALAIQLDRANQDRQALERAITAAAMEQAQGRAERARGLVLFDDGWHPGVVGIVASRVVERFHRPAVVIGMDGETGKGSCRSIEGFDMYAGLGRCAEHLVRFGGHHHAAGVTIDRARLPAFARAFESEANRQLRSEDLIPMVKVDADIGPDDATLELAQALTRLAPFGAGNPEPLLATEVAEVEGRVLLGKNGARDHLKFRLGRTDCIGFGLGDLKPLLRGRIQVAFQLAVDEWNGRERAQAKAKAIDPAKPGAAAWRASA